MSLIVLGAMLIGFAIYGVPVRQPDEGTAAHLFQLWLVFEAVMVPFFAVRWLPRKPREAFLVLAIQITAALAACAPVFFLNL
jgi:hypothetical protein